MNTGLHRIELNRLAALGGHFRGWPERAAGLSRPGYFGAVVVGLLAILIAAFVFGRAEWPLSFGRGHPAANGEPVRADDRRGPGARAGNCRGSSAG